MVRRLSKRNPNRARNPAKARGLIKNVIGLLFIPAVISITRSFYCGLTGIKALGEPSKYFLLGFAAYAFMYIVFFKMEYFYVLGHEFVHALSVWIFGGKILRIRVRKDRGSVTSTKKNVLIDLAPYLVPVYTVLIALVYLVGSSFWKFSAYTRHFLFFAGFSFSFHLIMTIDKMKIEQPDFLDFGYLNSLILIYLVNVVIIGLFFGFLFPDFVFKDLVVSFFDDARELYLALFYQLFRI